MIKYKCIVVCLDSDMFLDGDILHELVVGCDILYDAVSSHKGP